MPTVPNQWANNILTRPQQGAAPPVPLTEDQVLQQLGITATWQELMADPQAYAMAMQRLVASRGQYEGVLRAYSELPEDVREYLETTPYDEIDDPEMRTYAIGLTNANIALGVIDDQIEQAQSFGRPRANPAQQSASEGAASHSVSGRDAISLPGARGQADLFSALLGLPSLNGQPAVTASSPVPAAQTTAAGVLPGDFGGTGDGEISDPWTDLTLRGWELSNRQAELQNQLLEAELSQMLNNPGASSNPFLRNVNEQLEIASGVMGIRDLLNQPRREREEKARYEAEMAAAAAARQYAQWIQRKQLESSMANNVGQLQQNAWQHVTRNALPAGLAYVPGFEPGSRIAQVVGFGGLPTIQAQTPDPTAAYQWAQQYLGG